MDPQIPAYLSVLFIVLAIALFIMIVSGYRAVLMKSGIDEATRKRKVRTLAVPLLFWLLFLVKILT